MQLLEHDVPRIEGEASAFTLDSLASKTEVPLKRMAMGRGNCTVAVFLALFLLMCAPFHTLAATHVVGDSQGWGFSLSYTDWANGRTFAAGDTLVFNYQAGAHNVVPVSAAGYKNCKASDTSKAATTGDDKFTLKKGANYYICSLPGHCAAGMRLQVIAD